MNNKATTYEEAVAYIMDIPRFAAKNSMEDTKKLLERIGDISLSVPTIHIAGTNGKGSVTAFLNSCFSACGMTAGVFTSPHLVDIRERFVIGNEMISEEDFLACFLKIKEILSEEPFAEKGYHPSYFEFLFFMAMIWFGKNKPDVIILETGLGGRLDATNSILAPRVCIITEIGLDHMEYLGDSVEQIAKEKAGIIKEGAFVVFSDKVLSGDIIKSRAAESGCDYMAVSKNIIKNLRRNGKNIDFSLSSVYYGNANLTVDTCALYQAENGSLAFYALEYLASKGIVSIPLEAVKKGFSSMKWPGRMERISENIFIDGAHNEDGINAFIESVVTDGAPYRCLVYSAVADKNIEVIAGNLIDSGLFERFYIAPLYGSRGASGERLVKAFEAAGDRLFVYDDVESAFEEMKNSLTEGGIGYVAGSLYLVGKIKELLNDD